MNHRFYQNFIYGSKKCDTIMVYEDYIKILFASGSIRLIGFGSCGFTIGKAT